MSESSSRIIRSRSGDRQLSDLLQLTFGAELLMPSRCIWLVSPWITDVPIIDNRSNAFTTIQPRWPRTEIRLARVIEALAERGATVRIATRPDPINNDFVHKLESLRLSSIVIHRQDNL